MEIQHQHEHLHQFLVLWSGVGSTHLLHHALVAWQCAKAHQPELASLEIEVGFHMQLPLQHPIMEKLLLLLLLLLAPLEHLPTAQVLGMFSMWLPPHPT